MTKDEKDLAVFKDLMLQNVISVKNENTVTIGMTGTNTMTEMEGTHSCNPKEESLGCGIQLTAQGLV